MLTGGAMAALFALGHRTGLLDTMAQLPPSTSANIAAAANLNERYVREWLGGMVTGGVIDYEPKAGTYALPPEHAASLTTAAGPNNLASLAQCLSLFLRNEDELVECFRNGGGLAYDHFPGFQKMMAEISAAVNDTNLIDVTLPLVPGIVERLRAGIDVADVGCGEGHAINLMAKAFPNSRFTGFDFSPQAIAAGNAEARAMGNTNAQFEVADAAKLDMPEAFDFITVFDAVHDQADPAAMLANISRALRPGGTFLCVDIAMATALEENVGHPMAPFMYWVSTSHCMTVSLALGGVGLGTCWGKEKAIEMFADAGFKTTDVKQIEGDMLNNYYICQKV